MRNEQNTRITDRDAIRLARVVEDFLRRGGATEHDAEALHDRLDAARIVPAAEIAADVVTMNSEALIQDAGSGAKQVITLVYPDQADPGKGRVSVLSPLGGAVLGLPEGAEVDVEVPAGTRCIRIVKVRFQPEAEGVDDL